MNEIRVRGLDEGPFKAAVLDVVSRIPAGHVADFGDIAEALGYNREAAPLVGWVIEGASADVPWHRVTKPDGELPVRSDVHPLEQASLLGNEGIEVEPGPRVDLDKYRFRPTVSRYRGPIHSSR